MRDTAIEPRKASLEAVLFQDVFKRKVRVGVHGGLAGGLFAVVWEPVVLNRLAISCIAGAGSTVAGLAGDLDIKLACAVLEQRIDGALIRALIGKPSDYGLPDPDYRLYESHPVVNSLVLHHLGHGDIRARPDLASVEGRQVVFCDGSRADYDLILQATGYKLDYPFIAREELNWPERAGAPQLYLNIFHPQYDDLFMMGMVEASGLGWQGRAEQAELVALFIRQCRAGSASA
eukprot:gene53422-65250_t